MVQTVVNLTGFYQQKQKSGVSLSQKLVFKEMLKNDVHQ